MPLGSTGWSRYPPPASRGMVVAVCAPDKAADLGRRRGYLSTAPCPRDTEPLLKIVAGVPGDDVDVSGLGVAINGCALTNSAPLAFDQSDRRMLAWPSERYRLRPNQLWLFADNPRSWDSRYWGPARVPDVLAKAKPLFASRPADGANNRCFQSRQLAGGTTHSLGEDE